MSPEVILVAAIGGIIPALIWLLFWLREDALHPEPKMRLALAFIAGAAAVGAVLPLQTATYPHLSDSYPKLFVAWAIFEEVFKLAACYFAALRYRDNNEPVDAVIYMLTTALGFTAMENTLYLLGPLASGSYVETIVTGNMRFIGASLLHVISSGVIGVFIALSFYRRTIQKRACLLFGIALSVALHALFNLFIMKETHETAFATFSIVWLAVVVLMLLFEKVKKLKPST